MNAYPDSFAYCLVPEGVATYSPPRSEERTAFLGENAPTFQDADEAWAHTIPMFLCGACASTFDVAWDIIARHPSPSPDWTSVIAHRQEQGRGQMRRAWHSPPGNLYVSFVLPRHVNDLGDLASLAAGLLIQRGLTALGMRTSIKWPNDLILSLPDGREGKFGGILLEERNGILLAGLGLNLRHAPSPDLLREGYAFPAVAPDHFTGSAALFWARLLEAMRLEYASGFSAMTPSSLSAAIAQVLAWQGHVVRAEEGGTCGYIEGVSEDGSLLVRTAAGERIPVHSGSVRLA